MRPYGVDVRKHYRGPDARLKSAVHNAMKLYRARGGNGLSDPLADRAALYDRIAACTQRGVVAVGGSGTDCDGYRWESEQAMSPRVPRAIERYIEQSFYSLDGPGGFYVLKPREAQLRRRQRMEAAARYY